MLRIFLKIWVVLLGRPRRPECETVADMPAQGGQSARQSQIWPPRAPSVRDSRKHGRPGRPACETVSQLRPGRGAKAPECETVANARASMTSRLRGLKNSFFIKGSI